jgi:hypothetical protein
MLPGALPISQIILLDLIVPPIGAVIWRLMAGGWAGVVQGDKVSEETRGRQWTEFWAILGTGYFIMFGATIYYSWTT